MRERVLDFETIKNIQPTGPLQAVIQDTPLMVAKPGGTILPC